MASSSNPKSKKTKTPNPLDLSRLLKNDAQKQEFLANYNQRPLMTPKYGSLAEFEALGCTFPSLIRAQGLHVFVEDHGAYCPDLIRAFYCNLEVKDNVLHSWVKGQSITLTLPELAKCLSIPCVGADLGGRQDCPWADFNKRDFYFSLCRFTEAEISRKRQRSTAASATTRDTLGVGNLTVEYRLLHYFLVYIIYQKGSNYSQVQELDLQMLYGLVNMESINWAFVILYHMLNAKRTSSPLPYAFAITRILKKFKVDFSIELPVHITDKENKIDQASLGKMQIYVAQDGTLRHKDRQLADNEPAQQDPIDPQNVGVPPHFQLIMDELASQRAYMSSRMDTIDARLDIVDSHLAAFDTRMASMDSHFDEITSLLRNLQPRDPASS